MSWHRSIRGHRPTSCAGSRASRLLGPLRHRVVHRAQRQPARQRALSRPGSRRPARRSRPPPIADKARHVRPAHRYRPGRHAEEHAQLAARGSRPGRDQRASQRGCSPRRLHVSRRPLWSPESTVWRFRQDPAMRAGAGRGAVSEPGLKVVELERNLAARPARGGPTGCRRSCIPSQDRPRPEAAAMAKHYRLAARSRRGRRRRLARRGWAGRHGQWCWPTHGRPHASRRRAGVCSSDPRVYLQRLRAVHAVPDRQLAEYPPRSGVLGLWIAGRRQLWEGARAWCPSRV